MAEWLATYTDVVLAASLAALLLGTARVLVREARAHRPPAAALGALVLVWAVGLALRLTLSPRTFLHEYYHIAETIPAYLSGRNAPGYGETGPMLFHLVATLLRRPSDVQIIFLTNAVVSSLAIPAVALLDLVLVGSWPRALCAAVLLCALPHHLRFSAAEDLFVQAITFGLWALGLFMLYLRTRRRDDAVLAAMAIALAMQARPEMIFFPAVVAGLAVAAAPGAWGACFDRTGRLALLVLLVLLVPRLLDLWRALREGGPTPMWPGIFAYLFSLVVFRPRITPPLYVLLLALGLWWGVRHRPRLMVWVGGVIVACTLFSVSLADNAPSNLRMQTLPMSFSVLIAAGAAPLWMDLWGARRRAATLLGAGALAAVAAAMVLPARGFVGELRDQQLEWAFLERTVPQLPPRFRLLSAAEIGGRRLDAFPEFLLQKAGQDYQLLDLGHAVDGDTPWPAPGDDLLFYQGMFCYFAFDDEPPPDPMAAVCRAVHERYVTEPLAVEDLDTQGYSRLRYAPGPFRIGFYRVKALR